jgi:hypothetical protein
VGSRGLRRIERREGRDRSANAIAGEHRLGRDPMQRGTRAKLGRNRRELGRSAIGGATNDVEPNHRDGDLAPDQGVGDRRGGSISLVGAGPSALDRKNDARRIHGSGARRKVQVGARVRPHNHAVLGDRGRDARDW